MSQNLAATAVAQYLSAANEESTPEQWDAWRAQWKAQFRDAQKVDVFNYANSIQQTPVTEELINYLSLASPPVTPRPPPEPVAINFSQQHQGSPRRHGQQHEYFKSGAGLTADEEKFCRCQVHVMEKNDDTCVKSELGTHGCGNPFAICHRAGTYNRKCGESFDFTLFTLDELSGYVRQRIGPIPPNASREQLLAMIQQWKAGEH